MRLAQALLNGRLERGEVGVVLGIQTLFLDELPQPFNQVQIRGIRRQVEQLDVEARRHRRHHRTFLVARVVQHQSNGHTQVQRRQLIQERAEALGVDVGVIGNRDEFMGDGVQGPQDVEALPPRWGLDEHAGEAP